jgi:hypothetical protein
MSGISEKSMICNLIPKEIEFAIGNWKIDRSKEKAQEVRRVIQSHDLTNASLLYSNHIESMEERKQLHRQMK